MRSVKVGMARELINSEIFVYMCYWRTDQYIGLCEVLRALTVCEHLI